MVPYGSSPTAGLNTYCWSWLDNNPQTITTSDLQYQDSWGQDWCYSVPVYKDTRKPVKHWVHMIKPCEYRKFYAPLRHIRPLSRRNMFLALKVKRREKRRLRLTRA